MRFCGTFYDAIRWPKNTAWLAVSCIECYLSDSWACCSGYEWHWHMPMMLVRCEAVISLLWSCCCQDVEIKNQGHSLSYAFVQFDNIHSVVSALREMDGEQIGLNKIKVSDTPLSVSFVQQFFEIVTNLSGNFRQYCLENVHSTYLKVIHLSVRFYLLVSECGSLQHDTQHNLWCAVDGIANRVCVMCTIWRSFSHTLLLSLAPCLQTMPNRYILAIYSIRKNVVVSGENLG